MLLGLLMFLFVTLLTLLLFLLGFLLEFLAFIDFLFPLQNNQLCYYCIEKAYEMTHLLLFALL